MTGARIAYLVRHADAVSRDAWAGPDAGRPLSALGRAQAAAIGLELAAGASRAISSAALRCRETLAPAASGAGIEVEDVDELAEGADPLAALRVVVGAAEAASQGTSVLACSHGDVITGVIDTFAPTGVDVVGPLRAPKASVWELEVVAGAVRRARYVAPPPREGAAT